MLAPGTQIDRYELLSPVGEGGMAQVWVARQKGKHGFEKLFAFKCIHPRFADDPAFRSMFLDEARIASDINHPNVAQVFDLGELDSMLYLVIEYVDGESLGALMTAGSRRANEAILVPPAVAMRVMADACAGLQAAHALKDAAGRTRGVVHRDISPQNILVSVDGDVKIIDFGIAHAQDRIGGDTNQGSLKGKLHYMAPEQALRQPIGAYTDVFSAGATLYRMLAGRPPFDGGNDAATLQRLMAGTPPEPLPDSVPPLLAAIVERALSRDPGDRYATAFGMQSALEAAIVEEGYVADVATWVRSNLSDAAKARRAELTKRTLDIKPSAAPASSATVEAPSFVAELGPLPGHDRAVALALAKAAPAAVPAPAPAPSAAPAPAFAAPAPAFSAPAPATLDTARPAARGAAAVPIGVPPPDTAAGPGMLDVRALVARANSGAPHADAYRPPAPRGGDPVADPHAPLRDDARRDLATSSQHAPDGQPLAAPARDAPRAPSRSTAAKDRAKDGAASRAAGWTKLAVVATVLVLLLAGVLLLLPMVVRDRIVASARESGVDLTIDRVGLGLRGVSLRGVTARVARVPTADIRVEEVFASGLSAREVRVRGLDVKLTGHARDIAPVLLALYEENRPRLAGGAEPRRIAVVAAHIGWAGALGDGTRIEAGEIGVDFESRAAGAEEVRVTVGGFDVKTPRTVLGPWASSFERNPTTARLRLLLDPPVPDGPSALAVWGNAPVPQLTVRVPRSPLSRLGIRPADLGLPVDPATEIELKLEGGQSPTTRIEGSGRLDLFGVRLKGLSGPVDVKLEGSASGLPGRPLDLEKTTLTLGPFLANVNGAITPTEMGFRVDAAWRTVPVSCEKLARAEAKSMGPIAAAIQDIAHATKVARVTGTAHASGLVKYDTKALDEGTATVLAQEACGLSIFGM